MTRGLITVAALTAFLVSPAQASARQSLAPNSHNFGNQVVGAMSAPAAFTLTARCNEDVANPGTCLLVGGADEFSPTFSVGPDFQIVEEDCPDTMPGDTFFGTSCTVKVAFRPTALGARESILETGSAFARALVRGTGVEPPPPPAPANSGGKTKQKKCKKAKKRSASAAKKKKCKKKKKKKK